MADDIATLQALMATPYQITASAGEMAVGTGLDAARTSSLVTLQGYTTALNSTPFFLHKNDTASWRASQPFENQFQAHATIDGQDLYYTGFGSAVMVDGIEVYAVRVAHEHASNFAYKSAVTLYFYDRTATPVLRKEIIYTSKNSEDVRDVNISPHPTLSGTVLISFAEALSRGGYQTRLIIYNVSTRTVESNRLLVGLAPSDFKWGNALLTPTGHLMLCSYATSGTRIEVWRSTSPLTAGGDVTMTVAHAFNDTFASEPTIGYWQDRLVIFYRRTGAVSKLSYTYDLEGGGYWTDPIAPYGVPAHAPSMLAYSMAEVWTAFFSLGTDRRYVGSVSSNNLTAFKGQANLRMEGTTGGYTSMIDLGNSYAISAYSENHKIPAQPSRTRFDRIEIDKSSIDITPTDPEWVDVINIPSSQSAQVNGLMTGAPYNAPHLYASNGRDYTVEFLVTNDISATGIVWTLSGLANGHVEIYDGLTRMVTTTIVPIDNALPTPVLFSFPPETLRAGKKYRAILKGDANIAIYDLRHNHHRPAVLRMGAVEVVGLLNAAGVQQSATSLVPIDIKTEHRLKPNL